MKKLSLSALFLSGCNFLNPEVAICGDGVLSELEDCDDGAQLPGDHCDPSCRFEDCGNGVVDPGEVCDDQNLTQGDGCANNCKTPACGDGLIEPGELCFDPASPVNLGVIDLIAQTILGELPGTMRFVDLDDDQDLDYAISAPGSNLIVTGLNNGNALFQNSQQIPVANEPVAISIAKIDDDPFADLIVSRPFLNLSGDVLLLRGFGDGTFDNVAPLAVKSGGLPLAIIAADMDNAGGAEIAVLSVFAELNDNDSLDVFSLNTNEDGFDQFSPQLLIGANLNSTDITLADVDNNGRSDVITADSASNTVSVLKQGDNGAFGVPIHLAQFAQTITFGVTAGDLNNDERVDLAAVSTNSGQVTVNLQGSDGNFIESIIVSDEVFVGIKRVVSFDIDHDGTLDLIVTVDNPSEGFSRDVLIYRGLGDGTFETDLIDGESALSAGQGSFDLFIGDLNGDTFEDIAVLNTLSNDISIILARP